MELANAVDHFTEAVRLLPSSILFINNLGVALLNQGRPEEAMAHFERVLELQASGGAFATIKGLDPEAGAHLNIGHALKQIGDSSAAHEHWLTALGMGNYEHAVQAVQRLSADGADDLLPPAAVLDLTFGEALAKEGRTRDAALRYAAAHVGALNLTATATAEAGITATAIREAVAARMAALAEVWDLGDGALLDAPGPPGGSNGPRKVQMVQASADGTMQRTEMSQEEMMAAIRATQLK